MRTFEYSPIPEYNVNYLLSPGLSRSKRARLLWEMLNTTSKLPAASRLAIRAAAQQASKAI